MAICHPLFLVLSGAKAMVRGGNSERGGHLIMFAVP